MTKKIFSALLAAIFLSTATPTLAQQNGPAPSITPASLPALYLGQVATSGLIPDSTNTGAFQMMARTSHFARDNMSAPRLFYGNFYVATTTPPSNGTEAPLGANTAPIEAAIEYPVGVFHRVTFSGINQGILPSGGTLFSDTTSVSIPSGAQFWVRTYYTNVSGIIYCQYPNLGNQLNFGVTTANLVVTAGTISASGAGYGPLAIVDFTRKPTFGLIGDSRVVGLSDTPDTNLVRGYLARSVSTGFGTINLGVSSDSAVLASANYTQRNKVLAYVSKIISNYGINDIASGRTAAQTFTSIQSLLTQSNITGKEIWQTTYEPQGVTSIDGYITETNQVVGPNNTVTQTANAALRGGTALTGISGIVDSALSLESATTPGKWKAPIGQAITSDGTHANLRGNLQVQSQVEIPAGLVAQ